LREQWDIVGAVEYVEGRGFGRDSIGVVGWSLGAASALMAMEHEPGLAAVVSDSAYANGSPLLARNALRPGLKIALRLVRDVDIDKVRPAQALSRTRRGGVLLIHGEDDRSVPRNHVRILEHSGGERVTATWIVPNAGHIGAYAANPEEYISRVLAFFDNELA
jgi:dipeptidyl aminopeptidase/acylaminoacyl peptidase